MRRKASVWRRTHVKKHKAVVKLPLQSNSDKKPKLSQEAVLKNSISQTSQLSMHIQQLLDECFVLAPNQLRGYLLRADVEVRDLLRLLTSKIGSTPDPDILPVDYFKEDMQDIAEKHAGTINTALSGIEDDADVLLVSRRQAKKQKQKQKQSKRALSASETMLALSASALLEELAESSEADAFDPEIKTLTNVSRRYAGVIEDAVDDVDNAEDE